MSRRYADVVEVRAVPDPASGPSGAGSSGVGPSGIGGPEGWVTDQGGPAAEEVAVRLDRSRAPATFLRRGRVYLVREVLAHWVEVGPWWRDPAGPGSREREVWRVDAAAGRSATPGVYDLCVDGAGRWTLARAYD